MEATSATLLLSGMGAANLVGRIIFGRFRGQVILLTARVLVANALSFLLGEFFPAFQSQAALAGVFGLTFGAYSCSTVVIIRTVTEDTTAALGLCFLSREVVSSVCGIFS